LAAPSGQAPKPRSTGTCLHILADTLNDRNEGDIRSAQTQGKSRRYQPPAINFHLQETTFRDLSGEGIGNASPKQQTRITANHYESV
jgi:hypothetical protein